MVVPHNFLDPTIIPKAQLALKTTEQIEVMVTNGEMIKSEGKLEGAEILLQGHLFSTDFLLLPLEGCDMVLGMQWLRTLKLVLWDFASLTIRAVQNFRWLRLRPTSTPTPTSTPKELENSESELLQKFWSELELM